MLYVITTVIPTRNVIRGLEPVNWALCNAWKNAKRYSVGSSEY